MYSTCTCVHVATQKIHGSNVHVHVHTQPEHVYTFQLHENVHVHTYNVYRAQQTLLRATHISMQVSVQEKNGNTQPMNSI